MKSLMLTLASLVALAALFSACSATDPYWDNLDAASWPAGDLPMTYQTYHGLEYGIDSVNAGKDSSMTVFGHLRYDSILIIQRLYINYFLDVVPFTSQINTMFILASLDTLDFRTLPDSIKGSKKRDYKFVMKTKALKSKTLYTFCLQGEVFDKKRIVDIGTCNSYKTK